MKYVTTQGVEIPALGFGTARFDSNDTCREAVAVALEAGYRRIDTAQTYGTEPAVGAAIADAEIDREELFVATKLDDDNRNHERVLESTKESVDRLETEYVDLLLIHSPNDTVPHEETLAAMAELRDDGIVRHVGVSNFSVSQLRRAREESEAPIVANQVEYHPHTEQADLLEYCIDENVMLTAYSPLDVGDVAEEPTLAEIGERYGKTASQVAIRWLLQQEIVSTIPKAADPDHVRDNFDVFDFELADDEMREIFGIAGGPSDGLRERLGL